LIQDDIINTRSAGYHYRKYDRMEETYATAVVVGRQAFLLSWDKNYGGGGLCHDWTAIASY